MAVGITQQKRNFNRIRKWAMFTDSREGTKTGWIIYGLLSRKNEETLISNISYTFLTFIYSVCVCCGGKMREKVINEN